MGAARSEHLQSASHSFDAVSCALQRRRSAAAEAARRQEEALRLEVEERERQADARAAAAAEQKRREATERGITQQLLVSHTRVSAIRAALACDRPRLGLSSSVFTSTRLCKIFL